MKRTVVFALAGFVGSIAGTSMAQEMPTSNGRFYNMETVLAVGGPVGLAVSDTQKPETTLSFTMPVLQRLRFPAYTSVGLEAGIVLPSGVGASAFLDVFRTKNLRVPIIDIGIFKPLTFPASVTRIPRSWDATFGVGGEFRIGYASWVTVNWRVFLPDPNMLFRYYGDFARPVVEEALKGGQLWVGVARSW